MKSLIILNGPMGAGKSTVGQLMFERINQSAFIDGDWCLNLHPFIGNAETRTMAVRNILSLVHNYYDCTACDTIILVWLIDRMEVYHRIIEGLEELDLEIKTYTLICSESALIKRWKLDTDCKWRTDHWLQQSLKSLPFFRQFPSRQIETDNLRADKVTDLIINSIV